MTELKIGAHLSRLRKKQGMTQEQLAQKVGVSAAAVSKWETDSSYPDITLLCPLARALGTSVNGLLQFEEQLSNKQVETLINEVLQISQEKGCAEAEKHLDALLCRYPNSTVLQFNAALVLDTFRLRSYPAEKCAQTHWSARKRKLLEQVRATGDAAYWQAATLHLADLALAEGSLEQAEALLGKLPKQAAFDPTLTKALLYLKREQPEQALALLQQRLFSLITQVQGCMGLMLDARLTPDSTRAKEIWEAYREVDTRFGLSGLADGFAVEIFLREQDLPRAAECLARELEAASDNAPPLNEALFAPGLNTRTARPAAQPELRRMLLQSLKEEGRYAPLLDDPQVQAAKRKLEESLC